MRSEIERVKIELKLKSLIDLMRKNQLAYAIIYSNGIKN